MTNKEFKEKLDKCTIERQVEDVYNEMFKQYFNGIEINYPFHCDGYFETMLDTKQLKMIMEYKYDYNLNNINDKCKVYCQVIAYLKQFDITYDNIPNIVVIADKNETFVLPTSVFVKYLKMDGIDWTISPSTFEKNKILFDKLMEDRTINPWVFNIFDVFNDFDFKSVYNKIVEYMSGVPNYIQINQHNVDGIFNDFEKRILKKNNKLSSNDKVSIFLSVISNDENCYIHPKKKNTLTCCNKDIKIDVDQYNSFVQQFDVNITPQQYKKLSSVCDRLLEDTSRRLKGEFYTPTPFVDYSHVMISNVLGQNWKSEYIVWDMACGTKNLTRDYVFNELYCSTLEQADLNISSKYNINAISFQYDFLNDGLEKLPDGLIKAFQENKKIVFFLNPPYGTATNMDSTHTKGKGSMKSNINLEMKNNGLGLACHNLCSQFIYRILKIKHQFNMTNCYIAFFNDGNYICSNGYKSFRKYFLENYDFVDGFMLNASYFGDVSSNWAILFDIWKSKKPLGEI